MKIALIGDGAPGRLSAPSHARNFKNNHFQGTKAFGTGLSPVVPNWAICVPALERLINHVEFEGRKTAVSNLPSPS